MLHGKKSGIAFGLKQWEKRGVEEPLSESVVRGPRDGFVESIRTNTALLRRRISGPELKIDSMKIGRYSKTQVAIAYMDGIVDKALVEEIKSRLKKIDVGNLIGSNNIEELIADHPYSPFPQLRPTERPDVVSGSLMEGRVAIIVDGTPMVLLAPITFFSLLHSAEDYYLHFWIATSARWLRYFCLIITLFLPSIYVAVITFHQEMIPTWNERAF